MIGVLLQVALVVVPNAQWVPVAVAVATALGVYAVRNDANRMAEWQAVLKRKGVQQ